ncbi:MAG: cation transporter [Clostridia bacterium]|nr:cation transporter [Clostridia bacterium]
MKKTFKFENLDCAHCAMKIEKAICAVDGVSEAKVNFFAQKITVEAADERFDEVMRQVQKAAKRVERDIEILN